MHKSIAKILTGTATCMLFGIAGCGGGGGSSNTMNLSVGDAPVDGAEKVVVVFTGVELTADGGKPVTITFPSPKTIDRSIC